MTNYATTEGGALIWIEVMAAKLTTSNAADGVDEVRAVQIFEPVLIGIMGVGTTVKVIGRRILPTFLVTCVL